MADTETDDLRDLLRRLEAALGNPKITRGELRSAVQIALSGETSIPVAAEMLRRFDAGRGGTRPPTGKRVG